MMIPESAEQRARVLIVDDQPVALGVIAELLSSLGYEPDTAGGGLVAMDLLAKVDYDIVLTDITMPDMDGLELQKHINKLTPKPDVILMTGYVDQYRYSDIIQLGAVDFLTKPIKLDDLEAKLCRAIRERDLLKTLRLDIIKRKRMEDELRHSKELSETVLNAMDDAVSLIRADDFIIIDVNRSFCERYGLSKDTIVGRSCYAITHHLQEPCCPPHADCPLKETVLEGRTASAEHLHCLPDGTETFVEITTSPIMDESGKVVQVVHIARDITDRKQAEQKIEENRRQLQDAFDQMSQLIQQVIVTQDIDLRYKNLHLEKCYEKMGCAQKECPCYGQEPLRCWQIAGTFCGGKEQGAYAQKYRNCKICQVFRSAANGPVNMIGEHFNNMMHILEQKHHELQKALSEIKTLRGIVPICSYCKQIRDDEGFWNKVESYVGKHTEALFSHGVCPDCARKHFPEMFPEDK